MRTLNPELQTQGPSLPVLALCWAKAILMSAKQRWMLTRVFYLKP